MVNSEDIASVPSPSSMPNAEEIDTAPGPSTRPEDIGTPPGPSNSPEDVGTPSGPSTRHEDIGTPPGPSDMHNLEEVSARPNTEIDTPPGPSTRPNTETVVIGTAPLECPFCACKFPTPREFFRHIVKIHKYLCPMCNAVFPSADKFLKHAGREHLRFLREDGTHVDVDGYSLEMITISDDESDGEGEDGGAPQPNKVPGRKREHDTGNKAAGQPANADTPAVKRKRGIPCLTAAKAAADNEEAAPDNEEAAPDNEEAAPNASKDGPDNGRVRRSGRTPMPTQLFSAEPATIKRRRRSSKVVSKNDETENKRLAAEDKTWVCRLCNKLYTSHTLEEEQTGGRLQCCQCSAQTTVKGALRAHCERIHLKLRPFTCDTCQMGFYAKAEMVGHKKRKH